MSYLGWNTHGAKPGTERRKNIAPKTIRVTFSLSLGDLLLSDGSDIPPMIDRYPPASHTIDRTMKKSPSDKEKSACSVKAEILMCDVIVISYESYRIEYDGTKKKK